MSWQGEVFTALRFGLVGGVATLTHIACVVAASVLTDWSPLTINTAAFLVAVIVAGAGHSLYTFRLAENRAAAVARYVFLSAVLLGLSNAVLYGLAGHVALPLAKAVAIGIVPVASYLLSRFWAFAPRKRL